MQRVSEREKLKRIHIYEYLGEEIHSVVRCLAAADMDT